MFLTNDEIERLESCVTVTEREGYDTNKERDILKRIKKFLVWTTDIPKEGDRFYAVCIIRDDGSTEYSFARTSFDYYGKKELCFYIIGDEVPRQVNEFQGVWWIGALPVPESP